MNRKPNPAAGAPVASLLASLLASVSTLAVGLPAQAAAPATVPASAPAVGALVRQSEYWRGRDRRDLANQALQRAYAAAPRDPEVLAALAKAAMADGDRAASDRWIQQLKAVSPNDARLAALATAQRAAPPAAALGQARRLAQSGQAAAAVAAYKAIFDNQPPPAGFRLEYYQTLAGVPANWAEGRQGLQRLLTERPDDASVKLAYAQALTYQETARREGISRLAALRTAPPAVAQQAMRAWRQALIWLSARQADKPLYQAYLSATPNDQEVSAKFAQIDADTRKAAADSPPPDRGAALREQGYAALERRDDGAAEARFQEALRIRSSDADALGGLGLIKLRAQNFTEARTWLQRAIAAAPASRARWQAALDSAEFFTGLRNAQAAAQAGEWAKAEQIARPLANGTSPDRKLAQQQLADALVRQGKAVEAEPLYRALLAAAPSPDVRNGLIESLLAQNKLDEASRLAEDPTQRAALSAARGRVELARANQLWTSGDVAGAEAAFETALAARPEDPWTRYDFSRFLGEQGRNAAAEGLMAPVAALNTPEALYVAALFSQRQNRPADAYAMIAQIPANARTADMSALMGQLRISAAIADAEAARAAGRSVEALSSLRAIIGQPGLTVGAQGQVASALYDLGDAAQALALAQGALMQQTKDQPAAYEGFVAVLAKAGRDAEASALIRQLASQATTVQNRQGLADLTVTLASERADRLRLSGDLAAAFDTLSATFPTAPNNPRLLGALARLYQTGGLTAQAGAAYEQLLRMRPGDQDALVGAAQAAIARKDWARARQTLTQAMAKAPRDANLYLLAASLEEGTGDKKAAVKALQTAKSLRQNPFGYAPQTGAGAAPFPGAAGPLGPNPFAPRSGGYGGGGYGGGPAYQPQSYQPPATVAFMPTPAALPAGLEGAHFQPAAWAPPIAGAAPGWSPPITAPAMVPEPQIPLWRTAAPPAYAPPYGPPAPTQPTPTSPTVDRSYLYGQNFPPYTAPPAMYGYPAAPPVPAPAAAPQAPWTMPVAGGPFSPQAASTGGSPDPVLRSIDDRIASLSTGMRPQLEARTEYRSRSGEAGLSKLTDVNAEVSMSVSPFSAGKLTLALRPVTLDGGTAVGDSVEKIGFNPIESAVAAITKGSPAYANPGALSASGVGANLAFELGPVALDAGTTPMGFTNTMVVGGLSFSPRLGRNAVAKLWAERRAVTDSVLSYAGLEDPRTGRHWGQVMRTTAGLSFSYDTGGSGFYADGARSEYSGSNVAENKSNQFNFGAYIRPYIKGDTQVQVGLNVNHQSYDNNQNFFTFGHGGYFSPQKFTSLSLPVSFKTRAGDWDFELQGVPGYQTYTQNGAPYFPDDQGLESVLVALARSNPDIQTGFADASAKGFGILASGKAEYRLSSAVRVGGSASFNNFGNYNEAKVGLYARQMLGAVGP